jgi:hypothetical protein
MPKLWFHVMYVVSTLSSLQATPDLQVLKLHSQWRCSAKRASWCKLQHTKAAANHDVC